MSTKLQKFVKACIKSKTIIFSFILTMFGILQTQLSYMQVLIEDPKHFAAFCVFVSFAVGILRFLTTESLYDKVKEEDNGEKTQQ